MLKAGERDYLNDAKSENMETKLQILDDKIHRRFSNQLGIILERIEHLESTVSLAFRL
jgi:hypothetical protein